MFRLEFTIPLISFAFSFESSPFDLTLDLVLFRRVPPRGPCGDYGPRLAHCYAQNSRLFLKVSADTILLLKQIYFIHMA